MEDKKLTLRKPLKWTQDHSIEIYDAISKNKIPQRFAKEIKIAQFSPYMSKSVVGKYGWLTEDEQDSGEYESILKSGKVGVWPGQGPWTRGLFCKVSEEYIGKEVYEIKFDFTDNFIEQLKKEGINRRKDLLVFLIKPHFKAGKVELIPVEFASLYCPEWDDDHPVVLEWLEEWREAVKEEEETGFNPLLDPW